MAAVTICSDFGAQKIKSVTVSIVSPSISHEVMGPDAMIFVFWMLSFKPTFSLSSFTFKYLIIVYWFTSSWLPKFISLVDFIAILNEFEHFFNWYSLIYRSDINLSVVVVYRFSWILNVNSYNVFKLYNYFSHINLYISFLFFFSLHCLEPPIKFWIVALITSTLVILPTLKRMCLTFTH